MKKLILLLFFFVGCSFSSPTASSHDWLKGEWIGQGKLQLIEMVQKKFITTYSIRWLQYEFSTNEYQYSVWRDSTMTDRLGLECGKYTSVDLGNREWELVLTRDSGSHVHRLITQNSVDCFTLSRVTFNRR